MSFNQRKPVSGHRGAGMGRGRGSFHKPPSSDRFKSGSFSSTGSANAFDNRDLVAPIWIDPNLSRTDQAEMIKKLKPAAKYNVLLPFRRAKLFCPRSYQQSLYTPTLILVQELLTLAEASCASPMSKEDELEVGQGIETKETSAPPSLAKKQTTKYILDE